jgi:hypothetical protein
MRSEGCTDTTKLMVVFRDLAKRPKNYKVPLGAMTVKTALF